MKQTIQVSPQRAAQIRATERDRVYQILSCNEAKASRQYAAQLALNSGLSAHDAIDLLALQSASVSRGPSWLSLAMHLQGNPLVGADVAVDEVWGDDPGIEARRIVSLYESTKT